MRTFDLSPLYRSSVGFDRLGSLVDTMLKLEPDAPSYPPYNIERVSDNAYRITMAVAGFSEEELSIEAKEQVLTVSGRRSETEAEEGSRYLHRGIATRSFERRFQLADHVKVTDAQLTNGLLHIDLERELPEAMKPRKIGIKSANGSKVIEGETQAA